MAATVFRQIKRFVTDLPNIQLANKYSMCFIKLYIHVSVKGIKKFNSITDSISIIFGLFNDVFIPQG